MSKEQWKGFVVDEDERCTFSGMTKEEVIQEMVTYLEQIDYFIEFNKKDETMKNLREKNECAFWDGEQYAEVVKQSES